jgi:tetratricopeptide (TPR) repeat protein
MLYSPLKRLKSTHSRLTPVFLASISLFLFTTAFLLTTPDSLFPAIAQTTDARQAEGDRLRQQGIQQYQTSQLRAALNSYQQALQIYRTIKNRYGESGALSSLGLAYRALGDYAKAIEYAQQQLAIDRYRAEVNFRSRALSTSGIVTQEKQEQSC